MSALDNIIEYDTLSYCPVDNEIIHKSKIGTNSFRIYNIDEDEETYCDIKISIEYEMYDNNTEWYFIYLEFSYDNLNSNSIKAHPFYNLSEFSEEIKYKMKIINQKNKLTDEIVNYLIKNNDEIENIEMITKQGFLKRVLKSALLFNLH